MTQQGPTSNPLFDDLKTRSVVAVIFGCVAFFFVWLGSIGFSAFMGAITALMLVEFARLVKEESRLENLPRLAIVICGALSVFLLEFSGVWFTAIASLGLLIAATFNRKALGKVTVIGYAIIVIGAASAVHIRGVAAGFPIIIWIVLCVAAADIGGYMFGRLLQGPKLLPRISPKKTWSGFLGGIGLSAIVAIIFSFFSGGGFLNLLLFGIVIAVVSVAGDLLESSVKRKFGVKDAGTLLPGHGGLLDRLDGMTLVMVFFGALSFLTNLGERLSPDYAAMIGNAL